MQYDKLRETNLYFIITQFRCGRKYILQESAARTERNVPVSTGRDFPKASPLCFLYGSLLRNRSILQNVDKACGTQELRGPRKQSGGPSPSFHKKAPPGGFPSSPNPTEPNGEEGPFPSRYVMALRVGLDVVSLRRESH